MTYRLTRCPIYFQTSKGSSRTTSRRVRPQRSKQAGGAGVWLPWLLAILIVAGGAYACWRDRQSNLLRSGDDPKILNISSTLGSLSCKSSGGGYSCSSSKAALNMITRTLALDLESDGLIAVAIHPGWVRTDMGGRSAPLGPTESVRGILDLADDLTQADSGAFYTYEGREAPW